MCIFVCYTGTVVPENLDQNVDGNALTINSNVNLRPVGYLPESNKSLKKNPKKKGKIRFKCLHCEYLTFKKQNLVAHLRQKHEVIIRNNDVTSGAFY